MLLKLLLLTCAVLSLLIVAKALPISTVLQMSNPQDSHKDQYVCKGTLDFVVIAKLDRICEDCDNLFTEDMLYDRCKEKCFTTKFFHGCVQALTIEDRLDEFKKDIIYLHGADPHL